MSNLKLLLLLGVLGACNETRSADPEVQATTSSASTTNLSGWGLPTNSDLSAALASSSIERVEIAKFGGGTAEVDLEHHVREVSCKSVRLTNKPAVHCKFETVWLPAGATKVKLGSLPDELWKRTNMFLIKDGRHWHSAFPKAV